MLTKEQWIKILKGTLISAFAAGLVYAAEMFQVMDFGIYTPLVQAALAAVVNIAKVAVKL